MANIASTKIVVISKDNKKKLELLKHRFTELKDWKLNVKTDFAYSILLKDKTYLIVINAVKKTVEEQLESLKLTN